MGTLPGEPITVRDFPLQCEDPEHAQLPLQGPADPPSSYCSSQSLHGGLKPLTSTLGLAPIHSDRLAAARRVIASILTGQPAGQQIHHLKVMVTFYLYPTWVGRGY